jgi:hypothetical protein
MLIIHFTTLLGRVESLETFWKNFATMPLGAAAKSTQAKA